MTSNASRRPPRQAATSAASSSRRTRRRPRPRRRARPLSPSTVARPRGDQVRTADPSACRSPCCRVRPSGGAKVVFVHDKLTFAFCLFTLPVAGRFERFFAQRPNGGSLQPLTKRQREILDYLNEFIQQHGYAPSLEEIGERFSLSSLATVHKHLTNLQEKGFIRRAWNRSRSVELLPSRVRRARRRAAAARLRRRRHADRSGRRQRDASAFPSRWSAASATPTCCASAAIR